MALVQRLVAVNDRMQALADSFGIPQYGNVVMVYNNTQTLLTPRPKVMSMTRQEVISFMTNNVEINDDDRWLEGVSRAIPESQLEQSKFIINATQAPNGLWVGKNTQVKFIDRNRLMDYRILVGVLRGKK
jgi:hypothetical protein